LIGAISLIIGVGYGTCYRTVSRIWNGSEPALNVKEANDHFETELAVLGFKIRILRLPSLALIWPKKIQTKKASQKSAKRIAG